MSQYQLLRDGLHLLSEACACFNELEHDQGIALSVMVNNALLYGRAILNDKDPRDG
jgi:hypothetical protein